MIKWILGFFFKDKYEGFTPAEVEILKRLERSVENTGVLTDRQKLSIALHELGHLEHKIEEALSPRVWQFAEDRALNPAFHVSGRNAH